VDTRAWHLRACLPVRRGCGISDQVQPIFAGGRIRSGVRFSEARQQDRKAQLMYQRTIQQAFRGVSDSLRLSGKHHRRAEVRLVGERPVRHREQASRARRTRLTRGFGSTFRLIPHRRSVDNGFQAGRRLQCAGCRRLVSYHSRSPKRRTAWTRASSTGILYGSRYHT
jgi:hypothetical protein